MVGWKAGRQGDQSDAVEAVVRGVVAHVADRPLIVTVGDSVGIEVVGSVLRETAAEAAGRARVVPHDGFPVVRDAVAVGVVVVGLDDDFVEVKLVGGTEDVDDRDPALTERDLVHLARVPVHAPSLRQVELGAAVLVGVRLLEALELVELSPVLAVDVEGVGFRPLTPHRHRGELRLTILSHRTAVAAREKHGYTEGDEKKGVPFHVFVLSFEFGG